MPVTEDEAMMTKCIEMLRSADQLGYPCILKTAEGGYDGHGQVKFESRQQLVESIVNIFKDVSEENVAEFEELYQKRLPLHEEFFGVAACQ